jgi:hypothetical protein
VESLIALVILVGAMLSIAGSIPVAALVHRGALERERALALAQFQLEYFLTNPGPIVGESGVTAAFTNYAQFSTGYTGSYNAYAHATQAGLTVIVVRVTPPHGPAVVVSAVDTTYSNITP